MVRRRRLGTAPENTSATRARDLHEKVQGWISATGLREPHLTHIETLEHANRATTMVEIRVGQDENIELLPTKCPKTPDQGLPAGSIGRTRTRIDENRTAAASIVGSGNTARKRKQDPTQGSRPDPAGPKRRKSKERGDSHQERAPELFERRTGQTRRTPPGGIDQPERGPQQNRKRVGHRAAGNRFRPDRCVEQEREKRRSE
jgi:hypothetical protein